MLKIKDIYHICFKDTVIVNKNNNLNITVSKKQLIYKFIKLLKIII